MMYSGGEISVSSWSWLDEEGQRITDPAVEPTYRLWKMIAHPNKTLGFIALPVETDGIDVLIAAGKVRAWIEDREQ